MARMGAKPCAARGLCAVRVPGTNSCTKLLHELCVERGTIFLAVVIGDP